MATVHPLWRDSDAWNQLTRHPSAATSSGHGLLYCFVARVPLYLGYLLEQRQSAALSIQAFFEYASVTDTGVLLLIAAQHVALAAAAYCFIVSATRRFWVRLVLAAAFASNPIFPTFAHCVGSETLSMILVLVLATVGLRLLRKEEPRWSDWYVFAVAFYFCLVARYVNLCLLLLLPLTFAFSLVRSRARAQLRGAGIAILVAIASVAVARQTAASVGLWKKVPYHSRFGFTFLWRLQFLTELPPPARAAVLEHVAARTSSRDAQSLIAIVRELLNEGADLQAGVILDRFSSRLPEEMKRKGTARLLRQDFALNEMARAFLTPPTPEHLRAAREDFAWVRSMPLPNVTAYLYQTTASVYDVSNEMPQIFQLITYRNATRDQINARAGENGYVRFWPALTLNHCLCAFALELAGLLLLLRKASPERRIICGYGVALGLVGMAMVYSTCLFGGILPRYTLPMWELIWIALLLYAGALADALLDRRLLRTEPGVRTHT